MGILRSPHEATCPSIASRYLLRGRNHVILHHDISGQACPTDRHGEYACPDRRAHRRGFCRRPAADSRRGQAQPSGCRRLGRRVLPDVRPSSSACAAQKLAQGTAAWLRHADVAAETLEGGFEGWKAAKLPLVAASKLPPRDAQGRTVWVTRARPKIDRIACPWLIRRFVDPNAVFLFVAPSEVDRGRRALQCHTVRHRKRVLEPSRRALHLRRDDRGVRPGDAAAAAAGDHGARRRYRRGSICRRRRRDCWRRRSACRGCIDDDLEQLEAGMVLYDAFYRWCRDATGETHNWPTNKAKP